MSLVFQLSSTQGVKSGGGWRVPVDQVLEVSLCLSSRAPEGFHSESLSYVVERRLDLVYLVKFKMRVDH
jgi:hypothetical protein